MTIQWILTKPSSRSTRKLQPAMEEPVVVEEKPKDSTEVVKEALAKKKESEEMNSYSNMKDVMSMP